MTATVFNSNDSSLDENPLYKKIMKDLTTLGLHPNQNNQLGRIRFAILLSGILTMLIPIGIQVFTSILAKDIDGVMYAIPVMNTDLVSLIKGVTLNSNREQVITRSAAKGNFSTLEITMTKSNVLQFKEMYNLVAEEWVSLKSKDEIRTLESITRRGTQLANLYRAGIIVGCLTLAVVPLIYPLLDMVLPRNETRLRQQMFELNYLVDGDEYFYPIYFHLMCTFTIVCVLLYTVDCQYMVFSHHTCGLFAICGYQIQRATESVGANTKDAATNKAIYQEFKDCVVFHHKAIKFYDFMNQMNRKGYLLTIGLNMLCISVTAVQLVMYIDQPAEFLKIFIFLLGQKYHLFFISLPGQRMVDYSLGLAENLYSSNWYDTPVSVQKILYTMQIRCSIPCTFSAGGLYDMNMENFGMIIKSCVSYFTMLTSGEGTIQKSIGEINIGKMTATGEINDIFGNTWYVKARPVKISSKLIFLVKPRVTVVKLSLSLTLTPNRLLTNYAQVRNISSVFQSNDRLMDNPYYTRALKDLIIIGQHPYQSDRVRRFRFFAILSIITSMLIPIWIQMFTSILARDIDGVMYAIPIMNTDIVSVIKLVSLNANKEQFKEMYNLVTEEWESLKTKDEVQTLANVTRRGNELAHVYRISIVMCCTTVIVVPLMYPFLDIILPRNESRIRQQSFVLNYLVDGDKYFYHIYVHLFFCVAAVGMTYYTIDCQYMVFTHHACGLFALCGYQIQRATETFSSDAKDAVVKRATYQDFKNCMLVHQKAIKFYELMNDINQIGYLLTIGLNMLCISVTAVQLIMYIDQPTELIKVLVFLCAQKFHLFFISLPGQRMLDYSLELAENVYGSNWYETPVRIQKICYMMQIRCSLPCTFTAGGLYDMNMENFGMIIKTCMSYFTMLVSVRE
ncbi:uncharacterized protein LOC128886783 [Hylaeus anthracinus]|uniref:uncharacterized protein LOC128886783 n=1 Tax=Hylaeus anthracinus TaxID=313031 RepID=UPI0023B90EF1|nr:uncharacterized protein LOC128886783 [Hylaeus anthracinus]